jgi:hypothetical protein
VSCIFEKLDTGGGDGPGTVMSVESRESMEKAIFGSSDEDCDDAEVLSETVDPLPAQKKKRKTASGLRVRLSEKEKITIAR